MHVRLRLVGLDGELPGIVDVIALDQPDQPDQPRAFGPIVAICNEQNWNNKGSGSCWRVVDGCGWEDETSMNAFVIGFFTTLRKHALATNRVRFKQKTIEVEQFCRMAVWHVFFNGWFGSFIEFLQTKQTNKNIKNG